MAKINLMSKNWQNLIVKNFDEASYRYTSVATIQKFYAAKLAKYCSNFSVPSGLWVDLGSGTGLLANALEEIKPNQSVVRVDGAENMLIGHPKAKPTKIFNLNNGLPDLIKPPALIASSFVLHWLNKPEERLKEWFSALAPGGWLAISCPIRGSFPEWHDAATKANVKCTALPLPSQNSLLNGINQENIRFNKIETFTQEAPRVTSLLKQFVQFGAQSTPHKSLTVSQWRELQKSWLISKSTYHPKLTWFIQVLLAQK